MEELSELKITFLKYVPCNISILMVIFFVWVLWEQYFFDWSLPYEGEERKDVILELRRVGGDQGRSEWEDALSGLLVPPTRAQLAHLPSSPKGVSPDAPSRVFRFLTYFPNTFSLSSGPRAVKGHIPKLFQISLWAHVSNLTQPKRL